MVRVLTEKAIRKGGFTLIEMLVYIILVATLTIVTTSTLLHINKLVADFSLMRDLNDTATLILERVVREIRVGEDIDVSASDLGISPGKLVVNAQPVVGYSTIEFYATSSRLYIKRDDVDIGVLTPVSVEVTELFFDVISTGESTAVKISLLLTGTRRNVTHEKTFNTTTVLRGSY